MDFIPYWNVRLLGFFVVFAGLDITLDLHKILVKFNKVQKLEEEEYKKKDMEEKEKEEEKEELEQDCENRGRGGEGI